MTGEPVDLTKSPWYRFENQFAGYEIGGDLMRWLADCRERQPYARDLDTLLDYSDNVDPLPDGESVP